MSLSTLIIVGISIFIFVLAATLISVNRAYRYEHTIDEHPNHKKTPQIK